MKKTWYLLMILCIAFTYGCSTDSEDFNDAALGKNYFPLNIGDYRVYNVTAVRYLQDSVVDSSAFQIRERIDTLFNNVSGEPTYKIIRSRRADANAQWLDDSVITITLANNQLIREADNVAEVKMIFPVIKNKSWDPNVYNNRQHYNSAYYRDIDQPFMLNNQQYSKTVTAVYSDENSAYNSLYNKNVREEVYADGIGMIYRSSEIIDYCNIQACNFDTNYKLNGYKRIEVLDSYGKTE